MSSSKDEWRHRDAAPSGPRRWRDKRHWWANTQVVACVGIRKSIEILKWSSSHIREGCIQERDGEAIWIKVWFVLREQRRWPMATGRSYLLQSISTILLSTVAIRYSQLFETMPTSRNNRQLTVYNLVTYSQGRHLAVLIATRRPDRWHVRSKLDGGRRRSSTHEACYVVQRIKSQL